MALPDKHQLKFNIHKDAKSIMEAIEKRFGSNKETKKVQKTLLKQQYENFSGTSSEILDQIHDRLQKLISQLEILVLINNQVDDLSSHITKYTSSALTQKVFANIRRIGKGFSGAETPLFDTITNFITTLSSTYYITITTPSSTCYITITTQAQPAPPSSAPPDQSTDTSMTLLTTLMETYATLSQKVANLEQVKIAQALKIVKLKQRVKKLEKQRKLKHSGLKRLRKVGTSQRVESSPKTVLAKKERILDEQLAKRLQDKELEQTAAREKQEKEDFERAKVLQQHYDQNKENIDWNVIAEQMQEKDHDNISKYQSLKRKPISVAQARKNMIVYLKNMAGYKMEHFKGMTYDQVSPIFEREYKKVQTLFIPDKDVEETSKKRVAKETFLQESFKKLRVEVKVSGSHSKQEETPTIDTKEMSKEDVKNMLVVVVVVSGSQEGRRRSVGELNLHGE
nr:ribonuclease H-like domain-containing protein [Tanacetum cinerariifolium]